MHICEQCGKQFLRKWNLLRHMKIHNPGEIQNDNPRKIYRCRYTNCNEEFSSGTGLWQHKRRDHLNDVKEGKNKCSVCDKVFGQNIHLKAHMACHSAEKAFQCSKCLKKLKHERSLVRHSLTCKGFHGQNQPTCKDCNKAFSSFDYLRQHTKSVHKNVVHQCDTCGEVFKFPSSLCRHINKGRCPRKQ